MKRNPLHYTMLSDSEGKRKFFCTFHERISTCRRTFYERIPACSRTFYERNKRPPASFTPNARTTYVGRSGASHRPFIRAARRAHHCAASPRYVIAPLALVIRCAAAQGRRRGETLGHRGRAASPNRPRGQGALPRQVGRRARQRPSPRRARGQVRAGARREEGVPPPPLRPARHRRRAGVGHPLAQKPPAAELQLNRRPRNAGRPVLACAFVSAEATFDAPPEASKLQNARNPARGGAVRRHRRPWGRRPGRVSTSFATSSVAS